MNRFDAKLAQIVSTANAETQAALIEVSETGTPITALYEKKILLLNDILNIFLNSELADYNDESLIPMAEKIKKTITCSKQAIADNGCCHMVSLVCLMDLGPSPWF
jgi:uncharacterized protein YdaL